MIDMNDADTQAETGPITLGRLRELSKRIPGWCGGDVTVRFHPSLWDSVWDLPGFLHASRYAIRAPVENEFGKTEIFRLMLDPTLKPDTWAMEGPVE